MQRIWLMVCSKCLHDAPAADFWCSCAELLHCGLAAAALHAPQRQMVPVACWG